MVTTKHTMTRVELYYSNNDYTSRNTSAIRWYGNIKDVFKGYINGYISKIGEYETFDDWMAGQRITTVSAFDHKGDDEHYRPPQSPQQTKVQGMYVEDFDDVDNASYFPHQHQQGRTFVPNKIGSGSTATRSGYVNTGRVVVCGDPKKSRTIFQKGKSMYYKAKDHAGKFQYVRVKVKI